MFIDYLHYQCAKCEYQAKKKDYLKHHQELVHDVIKYPWGQCEYQASDRRRLKAHIQTVHKEIKKYFCEQCDYKANKTSPISRI